MFSSTSENICNTRLNDIETLQMDVENICGQEDDNNV